MAFFEFPHTRSYDSDLGWLIKRCKTIDETLTSLNEWVAENDPKIDDLEDFKAALEDGNLPRGVRDGLLIWAQQNIPDIIESAIRSVFFVLENGYFVAYIPDSWDEITFGTSGLDDFPAGIDFGHLTLSY